MTTRVVATEADRQGLMRLLQSREIPFTVEIVKGKRRSVDQNRMQRRLLNEIAEQTGQTAEEVRAYCKLTIGVPILRAESELFAQKYDEHIRPPALRNQTGDDGGTVRLSDNEIDVHRAEDPVPGRNPAPLRRAGCGLRG